MSKSQDEIEYHKITSFYEKVMYFTLGASLIFGTIIGLLTFSDRKSMLEEKDKTITELTKKINDLKEDTEKKVNDLKDDTEKSIIKTNKYAEEEISRIKIATNQIALNETQKQLSYIFGTDKIQNLIEKEAVSQVKEKVITIVKAETENLSLISDAASKMRIGHLEGFLKLKKMSVELPNSTDRYNAKKLLDEISQDYFLVSNKYYSDSEADSVLMYPTQTNLVSIKQQKKNLIEELVKDINKEHNLNIVADDINRLSKITGQNFKPFEFEKINSWYKEWSKSQK